MSEGIQGNAEDGLATVISIADPMGSAAAAFYFDAATLAKGKEFDLDGFRFYFLGRGSVHLLALVASGLAKLGQWVGAYSTITARD